MADSPGARRRWAWALGAAIVAAGPAWWLSRGPVPRTVVASRPPVATATVRGEMPAPVSTPARASAPATAESLPPPSDAASFDKPQCGLDQRPTDGLPPDLAASGAEDDPDALAAAQPRPAGPDYVAATARLDAALRASADPYAHVVADWLDLRHLRTPEERVQALAGAATSTSDPRVYALAFKSCRGSTGVIAGCDGLSARRWAELDPGNAEPWAYAYAEGVETGDLSGQQDAMFHAAESTRYETRYSDAAAAVAAAAPGNAEDLAADGDATIQAITKSTMFATSGAALVASCRANGAQDANRAQLCARIGAVMLDHSDTILHSLMGGNLLARATGDASRVQALRAEWRRLSERWQPATGLSECTGYRNTMRDVQRSARLGELAALRERAADTMRP